MKNLLLLFLFSISLFGSEWVSYKEVYENRPNKPIFVFVSQDNCKYCQIERKRFVKDKIFTKFLNENFQTVYINQSKDFIPVDLMSQMTPAFYILEPKSLRMLSDPAYGAIPLDKMKPWLEQIKEAYNKYKQEN